MKLRISFQLLMCLIATGSFCQGKSGISFNSEYDLENPPRSVQSSHIFREVNYRFNIKKHNNTDSAGVLIRLYDTTGLLYELQNYQDGILQIRTLYKYYTDNTMYTIVEDHMSPRETYTTLFQYDSLGREVYKYYYNKDTTKLTIEQKDYNEKGQVIALHTKINADKFYLSKEFEYNDEGKLTKTITLDEKGEIRYSDVIEYELGKATFYLENPNGKEKKKEQYYNDKGQLVKVVVPHTWNNISGSSGSAVFDQNGVTENYIYNPDGTLFEWRAGDGNRKQLYRHYYYQK